MTYMMPIIMLVAFGAYAAWMMTKTKGAMATLGPAMQGFCARWGYRYADMPPEPLAPHVQRAITDISKAGAGNQETRYVRSFHGLPIQFMQGSRVDDRGYSYWCRWVASLPAPPRAPFHVADRSLASFGKAVREAFSNTRREWHALYPHAVPTGIPAVDERFVVFGLDPNAVREVFHRNPALVAALLGCTEVDLRIDAQTAAFADPAQENINAAMGGTVGQMAIGFDYAKRLDMTLPVHDRIAEVLALAARAAA
jgi:hypothetical protein